MRLAWWGQRAMDREAQSHPDTHVSKSGGRSTKQRNLPWEVS
jgi:hypothetical protein